MPSTLQTEFRTTVLPALMEKRGYTNALQVPKLSKVVLSIGIGTERDRDMFAEATRMLTEITGQKPVTRMSKKNIANFKLRENTAVGVSVTLRNQMMYDFLYRLLRVALPRVRDFRGVSPKSFDGQGNYSLGITDQTIFTEVNLDKMKHTIGMNVTIVTTANSDEEGYDLLKMLGVPFSE
jgi:large subunit ribosomal protein L5